MSVIRPVLAVAVLAGLTVPVTSSVAKGTPKPITGTKAYVDATPDPTGNAESSNEMHCNGKLPREAPFVFKAPAPGTLKVAVDGFTGDWTLQIRDAKDRVIGGDDVNPPAFESATVKIKTKQDIKISPCNLAGTPESMIRYTFTYAK